jgi:hypothetical protein
MIASLEVSILASWEDMADQEAYMGRVFDIRAKFLTHQVPSDGREQRNKEKLKDEWTKRVLERYEAYVIFGSGVAQQLRLRQLTIRCIKKIALIVRDDQAAYGVSPYATSFQFFAVSDWGKELLQVRVVLPSGQHTGLCFEFDMEKLNPRRLHQVDARRTWLMTLPWSDLYLI